MKRTTAIYLRDFESTIVFELLARGEDGRFNYKVDILHNGEIIFTSVEYSSSTDDWKVNTSAFLGFVTLTEEDTDIDLSWQTDSLKKWLKEVDEFGEIPGLADDLDSNPDNLLVSEVGGNCIFFVEWAE